MLQNDCLKGSLKEYVPSLEKPWNERRVHHLFNKLSTGAPFSLIQRALATGPSIIDDLLAIYCSQLRLPFYKYYLSDDNELREAFSFGHFVGIVSGLIGQVLGVWLLTISQNNYALVAIINAMSFFISTLLLLGILKDYDKKKEFTRVESELPPRSENRLKDLVSVTQKAFATTY